MTKIILSTDQQTAKDKFIEFILDPEPGEMAIHGHAGTGKTFLTKQLIEAVNTMESPPELLSDIFASNIDIKLTATTNKAAAVLGKMVDQDACTIHSLLCLKVHKNFSTGTEKLTQTSRYQPIHNSLIIIDEASMVGVELLDIIRKSLSNCKVLYILDGYQLAPIGETECPVVTSVDNIAVLSTIQRQALDNPIIALAEQYRQVLAGNTDVFPVIKDNGNEITRVDGDTIKTMLAEAYTELDSPDDYKILAWRNATVNQYNKHVRALHTDSEKFLEGEFVVTNKHIQGNSTRRGWTTDSVLKITKVDDKTHNIDDVICWKVYVGDVPLLVPLDPKNLKQQITKAANQAKKDKKEKGYGDWSKMFKLKEAFADLRPAYASTIHKSQGSTYNTVFINLTDIGKNVARTWEYKHKDEDYIKGEKLLKLKEVARLMYVAITRASHRVVLYGALGAVYNDVVNKG